eukprot:5970200-Pyramimonas_sp.AAC.1
MDLFRLVCYITCTSHYRMPSWVGGRNEDVLLKQYSADLASDIRTHRSTSASYQAISGPVYTGRTIDEFAKTNVRISQCT